MDTQPQSSWRLAYALPLALIVAGCGGGSGVGGGDSTATRVASVGSMQVTYKSLAAVTPLVEATMNGAVFTSMDSAAYTGLNFIPNGSLANTLIAYDRGQSIVTQPGLGGPENQLTTLTTDPHRATWSQDGRIAVVAWDYGTAQNQIFVMGADGAGYKRITSDTTDGNKDFPAWSYNNAKIAYATNHGLWVMNTDGTNQQLLFDAPTGAISRPAWSPDGTKIAYEVLSGGHNQIFVTSYPAGTNTPLTPIDTTRECLDPAWSPDGNKIAFSMLDASSNYHIYVIDPSGQFQNQVTSDAANDDFPSFSPDGKMVVFQRTPAAGAISLWTCSQDGQNLSQFATGAYPGDGWPSWSPLPKKRTFVGVGGLMGTGASGFLLGQVGGFFSSIVTFTATTPSSAHITAEPAQAGAPVVVYLFAADSITDLRFTNGYYTGPTVVIPTQSPAVKQTLISVNTTTGTVVSSVPVASKMAPKASKTSGRLAYDGQFAGIFDAHGKNIAPGGANHVEFNAKTGAVVSFR